jgi:hypothetical protein
MVALKIEKRGDELVAVLTDEAKAVLRADPSRVLHFEGSVDDGFTLTDSKPGLGERRERGRAFLERYRSTFEALAK